MCIELFLFPETGNMRKPKERAYVGGRNLLRFNAKKEDMRMWNGII